MNPKSRKKSKTAIVFATVFVMMTGAVLYLKSCEKAHATNCSDTPAPVQADLVQLAPNYYPYSPQALAKAQESDTVILYFWAPWCTTCSSLDFDLVDQKKSLPDGMAMLRVNYDQAHEMKKKYGIVVQHTFVQIDKSGNAISTWAGGELEDFAQHLK